MAKVAAMILDAETQASRRSLLGNGPVDPLAPVNDTGISAYLKGHP